MNQHLAAKPRVRVTSDGLVNLASRIGTPADKGALGRYMFNYIDQIEVEAAYRTSWFRKICDIVPQDEIREWRTWTGADEAQITLIDAEEKRLGLRQKVAEARIMARKDGGSAIVLGLDGNPSSELDPTEIKKNGLKWINVLNRWDIQPTEMDRDPASEFFRRPKSYRLSNGENTEVHPSRVIAFIGNPLRWSNYWTGWGDSLFVELRDDISRVDQIAASIASMVDEAKLDVIRIKNLMANLVNQQGEDLLVRRWGIVNTLKSSVNALMLDHEDEYDRKTLTFQGLPDIQMNALTVLAGKADIPATRLAGRSPQGMNSTGESDMRNYYDRIRAGQVNYLGPTISTLDECLIWSALGSRPKEIYYDWNPLYSLSEKEAADVEKIFADAAEKYANMGTIPDSALAAMVRDGIIERGQFPGAQKAFDDAEAEGDEPDILSEPTEAEMAEEGARIAEANARASDPFGTSRLVAANDAWFSDATPRTLYVSRSLTNAAEFQKWAKAQGFTSTLDKSDFHVTIAFSRERVDWMKMGSAWSAKLEIPEGGARLVERLGDKGAVVLLFSSDELTWRNEGMRSRGASWDWPEYQPHVTISYDVPDDFDLSKVEPYRGKLVFGPEIFAEVVEDWEKDRG